MRKKLIYILAVVALLSSCHDDVTDPFLDGTGKTPITVVTNLSAASPVTRAANAEWESGDELLAYIQHVKEATPATNPATYEDVTGTGVGPRLAKLTISSINNDHKNIATNYNLTDASTLGMASGETILYWDDFSNSASDATDLRTSGHALQVKYGYCYNGGVPNSGTELDTDAKKAAGQIGWTVAADQSAENAFKHSDLLYAGSQTPVAYSHGNNNTITGRDPVLTIPYTHAMSKVTIEVICDENKGFSTTVDNFASTILTLKNVNTSATVTGPTKELSAYGVTSGDVAMQHVANTGDDKFLHQSYSALIAPTVIKDGQTLAKIENVDGNNYDIILSDAVLTKDKDGNTTHAWSTQLAAHDATEVAPSTTVSYNATNGGLTKPGVHYMLTVTIKKQQIKVEATIQDWEAVSATGVGEILFDNDVTDKTGDIADALKTDGFDLYKSTTTTFGSKVTTISWNTTDSKWEYNPKIYWQNKDDKEYFRALSGAVADDGNTNDVNESLAMTQGRDVLWGTTAEHSGKDVNNNDYHYDKGAQIDPRTGKVPLEFEHAMSKISVNLKTSDGDDKVNLSGATISIINTYNEGKIDLNTGDISDFELNLTSLDIYTLSETVDGSYKMVDKVVIPQSLTADKDGTARTETPAFYQTSELTKIYNDNTSLPAGGGSGTYYLTSTLDNVNYDASELTAIYSDGTSISDGGSSVTYVTSTLDLVAAQAAVKYTPDEADEENEKHLIKDSQNRVPGDDGYETTYEPDYTPVTTETDRIPAVPEHYAVNANSKQATTSTFKCYKTNDSSQQHTPGELKSQGNKIMMYITLANGTRYSIELSKCKDSSDNFVTEWKRGEHYTYDITLGKEEILFRAIVKDWVEKTGSGDATLDWD